MNFRAFIAILTGKAVRAFCRIVHRGGTAKPGKLALKICPDLLRVLSRNTKCVVITGTNGKTTCTRIVEEGFHKAGLSCFANRSGANLMEGIATDFIVNSSIFGKCRYEYAVLECDEAASKKVCLYLQPAVIFVTNLFRDQVDRFGGVLNTRDDIRIGIQNAPKALLCLNADCPVTASLAEGVPNQAVFFGINASAAAKCEGHGVSDLDGCVSCGEKYEYDYVTFSHLGAYRCPKCGAHRPDADYAVTDILSQSLSGSVIQLASPDGEKKLHVNLPAVYNIYNAAGSYAAMRLAGVDASSAAAALAEFKCGFGRMEFFDIGKKGARMILVKNDAGCNQVIDFLTKVDEDFVLSVYLNNNISDGVDISWLESAEFERLLTSRVKYIYVSGMRADEMHDRLLRAGFTEEQMCVEKDCAKLIRTLGESEDTVFIMPTYTGMMETRAEIVKQFGGSDFWEG